MSKKVIEIVAGEEAPDFTLPTEGGQNLSLSDLRGKKVVLYFYPKDFTPGCTQEACDFRDSYKRIKDTGAVVLGISMDNSKSHTGFIEKLKLPFTLLSDSNGEVSKSYEVYKQKNLYGKKSWGIERSSFIIDEDGKIQKVFRKVQVNGHVEQILQAL